MEEKKRIDHVNYNVLDQAKNAFIAASRSTLTFAKNFGFVPDEKLGASANVFQLNLGPFLREGADRLYVTLLPEGLGTADDAKPDDLSPAEREAFWENIGRKTVGVMTNDAAATGMQTILISLYLPTSEPEKLFNEQFMKGFLTGFVDGCKIVGCVYFSGETPQLKTKIQPGKIDIAGALFGVMPPGREPIASEKMNDGDFIVFIESSGPHENGYTTLRALAETLPDGYRTKLPSGREYWEVINTPSHLYTPFIQDLLKGGVSPTNIEPITGHGWQKLMRSKKNFRYVVEQMLPVSEIFQFVQQQAEISAEEMVKIFNYGVGMAVFVDSREAAEQVVSTARTHKLSACIAGRVENADERSIVIKPLGVTLSGDQFSLAK